MHKFFVFICFHLVGGTYLGLELLGHMVTFFFTIAILSGVASRRLNLRFSDD